MPVAPGPGRLSDSLGGVRRADGHIAERHRHLPVHRHRGLDPAARAPRPGLGRGAGRPPRPAGRRDRRARAGRRSTAAGTPSSPCSRGPPTRSRRPWPRSARSRRRSGRRGPACGCGWACTPARPSAPAGTTPASTCTAPRASPPPRAAARCCSRRPRACWPSAPCPRACGLRDLGEHRLKDLSRPEHLHQLCIEGLPADFPPLRTLDAWREALPAQPTSFVGREREVAEARAVLERDAPADAHRAGRHGQDPPGAGHRRRVGRGLRRRGGLRRLVGARGPVAGGVDRRGRRRRAGGARAADPGEPDRAPRRDGGPARAGQLRAAAAGGGARRPSCSRPGPACASW